jgi:hypothetical protein
MPKWSRRWPAKPILVGSSPTATSNFFCSAMDDSSSPGLLDLLYLAQKELPRAALCRALLRCWEVNDQKGMSSSVMSIGLFSRASRVFQELG